MFTRPLFVGAHADDVELFAGGTLARCVEDINIADELHVIAFSRHRGQLESPLSEMAGSMKLLGVKGENWSLHDLAACTGEFQQKRESVAATLRMILSDLRPTVVITHQSTDTNQDHRSVYEEVLRVFKGKSGIICGCFPANDIPPADRRLFVCLTEEQHLKKLQALAKYKSQHADHRRYFREESVLPATRFWGSMIGAEYAEAFEVIRLIV